VDIRAHPPYRVRGKTDSTVRVEILHRLHQPDVPFLDQVEDVSRGAREFERDLHHQPEIGGYQPKGVLRVPLAMVPLGDFRLLLAAQQGKAAYLGEIAIERIDRYQGAAFVRGRRDFLFARIFLQLDACAVNREGLGVLALDRMKLLDLDDRSFFGGSRLFGVEMKRRLTAPAQSTSGTRCVACFAGHLRGSRRIQLRQTGSRHGPTPRAPSKWSKAGCARAASLVSAPRACPWPRQFRAARSPLPCCRSRPGAGLP